MSNKISIYTGFFKRIIDFLVALIIFLVLSPVFILVALSLAIANSGRSFFVQRRPGKKGEIFKVIKFKTMNDRTDKNGRLLPDAERLTRIGKFIRKTSLDELPKWLKVIKGIRSL
jgi:undecaprenyl phosphate N,N'-diacetylbacillosamine 1-phosphate transferase